MPVGGRFKKSGAWGVLLIRRVNRHDQPFVSVLEIVVRDSQNSYGFLGLSPTGMRLGKRLPPEFGAEETESAVQRDAADGSAAGGDSGIAGHTG